MTDDYKVRSLKSHEKTTFGKRTFDREPLYLLPLGTDFIHMHKRFKLISVNEDYTATVLNYDFEEEEVFSNACMYVVRCK